MIGGRVIETVMTFTPGGRLVRRLWVVDGQDELCVYAEPYEDGDGPAVRDAVWWQSGRIYFDNDKRSVRKVGFSFRPAAPTQKDPAQ